MFSLLFHVHSGSLRLSLTMEALFNFQGTSTAPSYLLSKPPPKTTVMLANRVTLNFNFFIFPNAHLSSSSSSFSVHTKPRKSLSLIVNARKKDKKEDTHNFVPKPDEVTGFFPESVLLKKVTFFYTYLSFIFCFLFVSHSIEFSVILSISACFRVFWLPFWKFIQITLITLVDR